MKNIFLILTFIGLSFASCKKAPQPTPSTRTTPPSPTSITLTVNNPTITIGQTATLTANGATSYKWSTGATTNTISVSPTSTTVYTVTGITGSDSAKITSTVTVLTSTVATKDSVWFDITFVVPSSTNTAFGYRYDTSTTRILVNGHKIHAGAYNKVTDVYVSNGNIIESRNYQFTSNTLTVPVLMNKGDSLTIEVDSVYSFFSAQTSNKFVDVLIDRNGHKPSLTNITTIEKYQGYQTGGRYAGQAPISGQQNLQSWYITGKFSYTWVNQ